MRLFIHHEDSKIQTTKKKTDEQAMLSQAELYRIVSLRISEVQNSNTVQAINQ